MPYHPITFSTHGLAETFCVRITDRAVTAWLQERQRLRRSGYPDRPPDVDTPAPQEDAERVGLEVETIVAFIDRSYPWDVGDPQVTDYGDFVALDEELAAAEEEARAAGLLSKSRLDA